MKLKAMIIFTPLFMTISLLSFNTGYEQKPEILNPLAAQTEVLGENIVKESTLTLTLTPTFTPTPTVAPSPTSTPIPSPTPTPTPTPVMLTSEELENLFTKYASQYSVDKELLKRIAKCESNFNTNAIFRDYAGLFQFASSSWISSRNLMGQDNNPSLRFSAEEAIKTAAFKISRGETNAWPNCSK